ncbi:hypothetical protein CBR_g11213 [Chara braunii]|uniref:Uncharacterized protein n=1 Tax=Chara braunii TaxID=69332 RepID=A0A388KQF8_CHABU|nr:hypothetical protein CBR_g11213 [Chara braunii]|eukprot:GBG72285.1 hypothetical protein CBR_g11213 [Chara braunii]
MSFATERAFGDQLLVPRGEISAIRQVHHPRISPDFLRLAQFFCTSGVYGAAEFRFTSNPQVVVLVEATAFQRRAASGISHVSTVVVFSGDIAAFDPARQAAIKSTLYKWGRDLATDWDRRLTRHNDECYPVDDIEVNTLREPPNSLSSRSACYDLMGFVFGAVDQGYRSQIVRELTIVIARLADELPLDIVSQSDKEPVPHVLLRTLAPSLQWSACIEERWADDRFPSRSESEEEAEEESEGELRRAAGEAAARLAEDEEEEREAEEEAAEAEDEEEEEEAYSEQSEEEEDEDDDEGVESGEDDREPVYDDELEWVPKPDRREEDPEAAAQHKKEVEEGKRSVIDPTPNDPSKDPKPPKPEHGDLVATTSSAATTRRRPRSRSSSPSAPARPPIRQSVDEGLRPSSPIHIPASA